MNWLHLSLAPLVLALLLSCNNAGHPCERDLYGTLVATDSAYTEVYRRSRVIVRTRNIEADTYDRIEETRLDSSNAFTISGYYLQGDIKCDNDCGSGTMIHGLNITIVDTQNNLVLVDSSFECNELEMCGDDYVVPPLHIR